MRKTRCSAAVRGHFERPPPAASCSIGAALETRDGDFEHRSERWTKAGCRRWPDLVGGNVAMVTALLENPGSRTSSKTDLSGVRLLRGLLQSCYTNPPADQWNRRYYLALQFNQNMSESSGTHLQFHQKTFQALRRFILSHHRPQQIITSKAVASGRLGDADPGLERNGSWVTSLRMRRQIDGSSERLPSEPFELTVNGPSWVQLAVQVPQKGIC
ncbi:uncharacterized protein [Paramormyrops kingsleyae]|uniref:uncharacterized protein isoform X1 n=1 Tax=Paramormyrops kingsleyae TaxID=1676925 RepID=UPI000CD6516A|nr:uncharacterized protein LOC111857641 isoform X2 [Paramormyrops kingsleyae]